MFNPGQLDRKVTLKTKSEVIAASGERVPSWTNLATDIPAKKVEISGKETNANGQEYATGAVVFTVRWRNNLTSTGRVTYESTEYNVIFTREIGRKRYLDLITEVKR